MLLMWDEEVHFFDQRSASAQMMVAEFGERGRGSPEPGGGYYQPPPSPPPELSQGFQRKELFSQRKQREFIPDNKKDESYWDRRRRNNEAAKRSREKRRYNDMILEQRVVELSKENHFLKAQLAAIREKYGIIGEAVVDVERVMATLPSNDQVLSQAKRAKPYPQLSVPTPVITSPPLTRVYPEDYRDDERFPFPFPPVLPPLNPPALEAAGGSVLNLSRSASDQLSVGSNNSLPHKLRHKSHLGDKDAAATALLSLQGIKQEPGSRASPPWDAEGSSDERDSGISIGAEWVLQPPGPPEDDSHLKSEVARLASEVASLKSMLSRKKSPALVVD